MRADLLLEKEYAFRDTETYKAVSKAFAARTGQPPPYAMLPQIALKSPKISHHMTDRDLRPRRMGALRPVHEVK